MDFRDVTDSYIERRGQIDRGDGSEIRMAPGMHFLVDGPYDGEARAIDDDTHRLVLPVLVGGKPVDPPRWSVYVRKDAETFWWVRDEPKP